MRCLALDLLSFSQSTAQEIAEAGIGRHRHRVAAKPGEHLEPKIGERKEIAQAILFGAK